MRYWLIRADQNDNNSFAASDTAIHTIVCDPPGRRYGCQWNTARVGDLVALVRVRNRNSFQTHYTPGVVAFGHITSADTIKHGADTRPRAQVVYTDFFFDAPISLHRLTRTPLFDPTMFQLSHSTCYRDSPLPLDERQWSTLVKMRHSVTRIVKQTRWDITPGTELSIAEIQDQFLLRRTHGRNIVLSPEGALAHPHSTGGTNVLVSHRTPNLFLFTDTSARNTQASPEADGSLLTWVGEDHANNRIVEHISAGRALRVFARPTAAATTARYVGQYVIDQHNPILSNPPPSKARGRCLRLHPWGPVHEDPGLWQPKVGQRYRPAPDLAARDRDLPPVWREHISSAPLRIAMTTHRRLQNELADYLSQHQLQPLSPDPDEPQFDLAWRIGLDLAVCEVKSLPASSEEEQLRSGFGQVSYYAEHYRHRGEHVHPVLYIQHQPSSPLWQSLCHRHDITLTWPDTIANIPTQPSHTRKNPTHEGIGSRL